MANYDVLKVDGSKSGSVELSDSVSQSNQTTVFFSKQSIYNVLLYVKVHTQ